MRTYQKHLLVVTALLASPCSNAIAQTDSILIQAGAVLGVPGEAPAGPATLLITDGRIKASLDGFVDAAAFGLDGKAVDLIDLREAFVLPGLMDTHVHLTSLAEPDDDGEVTLTAADLAVRAVVNARTTVSAGFTTVMDMGTGRRAHELAIYAVRDAVQKGQVDGPTILAAGSPISALGNSRTARYRDEVETAIAPQGVCNGADDCRRAVREQVKRGADFINVYNTGSLLSEPTVPQTLTDAELAAIVETAHGLGRVVIADGAGARSSAAGLNAALHAGVDGLDTAMFPDAETWRLLEQSQVFYIPHLYAIEAAVGDSPSSLDQGTMGWLPHSVLEKLFQLKQERPAAADAIGKNIRLVVASDPGVFPHGENARELVEYVKLGFTPMAAIVSATRHPAELFRLEDRGRLVPGMVADVIAVRGNPLQDISELTRVVFVMHQGRVVRSP